MRLLIVSLPVLLSSCNNNYELFRIAGFQQEGFSNKADVLFVIDNSDSMFEEAESLAVNFGSFLTNLTAGAASADEATDDMPFIDFQFGITTTDVETHAGALLGPTSDGIIRRGEGSLVDNFLEGLLCEAACIPSFAVLASDPNFESGQSIGDSLTTQFLDDLCGGDETWRGNCGSASEEGLEAVFETMCRSVPANEDAPTACFEAVDNNGDGEQDFPINLTAAQQGSAEGFLRENSTFVAVIVSDEGDNSRRLQDGDDFDRPEIYVDLYEQFGQRNRWALIGPALDPDGNDVRCPGTASDWGVRRYNFMVALTDGLFFDIQSPSCGLADFNAGLEQLGELLQNLQTDFGLQSVPIVDTMLVTVNGKAVDRAVETGELDLFDEPIFDDGWSYDSRANNVRFHGDAIPPNDAVVKIFYQPERAIPRELPF